MLLWKIAARVRSANGSLAGFACIIRHWRDTRQRHLGAIAAHSVQNAPLQVIHSKTNTPSPKPRHRYKPILSGASDGDKQQQVSLTGTLKFSRQHIHIFLPPNQLNHYARSLPTKLTQPLLMKLLLPLPLLLELLDLALGHFATIRQLRRQPISIKLGILRIALKHLLRRDLSLGPLLFFGLFTGFAGYSMLIFLLSEVGRKRTGDSPSSFCLAFSAAAAIFSSLAAINLAAGTNLIRLGLST